MFCADLCWSLVGEYSVAFRVSSRGPDLADIETEEWRVPCIERTARKAGLVSERKQPMESNRERYYTLMHNSSYPFLCIWALHYRPDWISPAAKNPWWLMVVPWRFLEDCVLKRHGSCASGNERVMIARSSFLNRRIPVLIFSSIAWYISFVAQAMEEQQILLMNLVNLSSTDDPPTMQTSRTILTHTPFLSPI